MKVEKILRFLELRWLAELGSRSPRHLRQKNDRGDAKETTHTKTFADLKVLRYNNLMSARISGSDTDRTIPYCSMAIDY